LKILKDQQLIAHFTLSGDSADVVPASQIPWLSSNEIPAQIISDAKIGLWEPLAVAMLAGVLIIVFYAPPTF
jgi:hypothetical protein